MLGGQRVVLRETKRAVTPFGGFAVFVSCGAILGRAGRRLVLHMARSWRGLETRIPLLNGVLNLQIPTSPKLDQALRT